ncbi:retrotransposon gag protein, partial [Trifolium medium]|nr:retrotransposon gag protein [Trifolium medium]
MEEGVSVSVKGTPASQVPPEKTMSKGDSSLSHREETMVEFRHATKKVELPAFNGEDPVGWISRAEIYFRVQGTIPEVRVKLAQLCMEGSTIHFFNSLIGEDEDLTWEQLKEALLGRYGGHGEGDVYEQLTELKQGGTVDEYITEFEYLIAQIPKLPAISSLFLTWVEGRDSWEGEEFGDDGRDESYQASASDEGGGEGGQR